VVEQRVWVEVVFGEDGFGTEVEGSERIEYVCGCSGTSTCGAYCENISGAAYLSGEWMRHV
jgi:hypothetical protein